jgi:hypothetical protein
VAVEVSGVRVSVVGRSATVAWGDGSHEIVLL